MRSIANKQTKEQIADIIRADILSGVIKGGDELTQEQVAEQTGLSRMPVREAFQMLEQEGFLIRLPNRHMRAIAITDENIRQYFSSLADLEISFSRQILEEKRSTENIEALIEKELRNNSYIGEFDMHLALSTSLDNEYLANIHNKWLRSFYLFSLKKIFKHNAMAEYLILIKEGIKNLDQGSISSGLRAYFEQYEKLLLKESEEN